MKEKSGISLGSRRTISELTEVSVDSKMVVKSPKKTMTHRKKRVEKLTDSPQNSLLQTLKPHSGAKNVNKRPCRSYTSLIEEAILKSPGRRLILRDIYRYFEDSYPYFKESKTGWKNSIRHNLSLSSVFTKVPRDAKFGPYCKGSYWMLSQDASKLKYELEKDIFLHKIKNIDNIYSNFDRAGVTHLGSILESVNVPLEFLNYKNSEIGNKNTSTIFPKLNGSNMITFNPSYRIQESNLNLNGSHNRDCNNFLASEAKLASFPTPVYGKIFPLDLASRSIISNGPLVAPTILPPISSTTTKSFQDVWITAGSPKLIDSTDTAYGIIDAPPPTASPQTSNKNLWRRGQLNSPPSTSTGYNEGINI